MHASCHQSHLTAAGGSLHVSMCTTTHSITTGSLHGTCVKHPRQMHRVVLAQSHLHTVCHNCVLLPSPAATDHGTRPTPFPRLSLWWRRIQMHGASRWTTRSKLHLTARLTACNRAHSPVLTILLNEPCPLFNMSGLLRNGMPRVLKL